MMTSTNDKRVVRRQKVLPSHTTIFFLVALAILTLGILQPRYQHKRKSDVSKWTSFQSSYHPVIAIDLGETYTRAALYKAGRIDMIIDHEGRSNIPSACSIWSQAPGSSARWLGRIFQKPPSLFKQDENINLDIDWPPQARTLKHIKDLAFQQTGQKFADVILTIQAHANDTERQSLTDAASLAGLTTLRIVNASQAAVMGYGLDKKGGESTIVVIDVGASGLRVSLMALDDGVFETLAKTGNETLGGNAYTERIVEWLGVGPGAENRMEVFLEAERIKHLMSDVTNELGVGKNHLSRKDFESITQDLIDGLSASMDQTLLLAGQNKSNIDFVVVTGGTSKLPQIRSAIKVYFGQDSRILTGLDQPDEAAARGIANLIPILGDDHECDDFLEDSPVGVGIETSGGLFEAIVPRFYYLPSRMSKNFTVSYSQDVSTIIRVYEGVRRLVQDNRLLAEFKLPDLEPGSNITVTLQRDSDFLTHVTVQTSSGLLIERARIELAANSSDILLKNEEMLRDLEDHDITREKIKSRVIELQQYTLYSMDLLVYSNNIKTDHQRDQIERLSEVVDWISTYATNCTLDEVDERLGQAHAVMGGADGLPLVF